MFISIYRIIRQYQFVFNNCLSILSCFMVSILLIIDRKCLNYIVFQSGLLIFIYFYLTKGLINQFVLHYLFFILLIHLYLVQLLFICLNSKVLSQVSKQQCLVFIVSQILFINYQNLIFHSFSTILLLTITCLSIVSLSFISLSQCFLI